MKQIFGEFLISEEQSLLQPDRIYEMLQTTYWAGGRSRETIERSLQNSLCFGAYHLGEQIAFARCVTDYATVFWLADVVVDERYRGRGVGKAIVGFAMAHESLRGLTGILATRDAHGLYRRFGFADVDARLYMRKNAQPTAQDEPAQT